MTEQATDDLGAELRVAVAGVYRRFRSEREYGELGDAALSVLAWLRKQGPQSLGDLSEHSRVTPGSMSQTVNRIVAGGYAVRTPDPRDGRRVLFELTPEGLRYAEETLARGVAWLDGRLASLSAAERQTLLDAARLMQRIVAD